MATIIPKTKIIAETIPESKYHYRIWDNGDVEFYYNVWLLQDPMDNTDLWKENIRKLIPGKRYVFISFGSRLPFEHCFTEVISNDNSRIILDVYGFDPIKCPECNSENTKDSRCLDCGEWL